MGSYVVQVHQKQSPERRRQPLQLPLPLLFVPEPSEVEPYQAELFLQAQVQPDLVSLELVEAQVAVDWCSETTSEPVEEEIA